MDRSSEAGNVAPDFGEPSDAIGESEALGYPPAKPVRGSTTSSLSAKSVSPKKITSVPAPTTRPPPALTKSSQPQKKVRLEKTDVSDILGRPAHWGAGSSSGAGRRMAPKHPGAVSQSSGARVDSGKSGLPLRPKLALSQSQRAVDALSAAGTGKLSFQPSWLRTTASAPPKPTKQFHPPKSSHSQQWRQSAEPHQQISGDASEGFQDSHEAFADDVEPATRDSPNLPKAEQRASRMPVESPGGIAGGTGGLRLAGRARGGAAGESNAHSSPVQHNRGPPRPGSLKHLLLKHARGADADELKLIELPFTERVSAYQSGERPTAERSASKDPLDPRNRARARVILQILMEAPSSTLSSGSITGDSPSSGEVLQWPSYGPFRVLVGRVTSLDGDSTGQKTARQLFSNVADSGIRNALAAEEPAVSTADTGDGKSAVGIRTGSTVLFIVKADSCVDESRQLKLGSSVRIYDPMPMMLTPYLCTLVSQLRLVGAPPSVTEAEIDTGVMSDTGSEPSINRSVDIPFEDIKIVLICTQLWEPIES